jgi:hypothetical protein
MSGRMGQKKMKTNIWNQNIPHKKKQNKIGKREQ